MYTALENLTDDELLRHAGLRDPLITSALEIELARRLEANAEEYGDYAKELDDANEKLDGRHSEVERLEAEVSRLENRVDDLEDELAEAREAANS